MQTKWIEFLCRAKQKTYAGKGAQSPASRPESHDLQYHEGEMLYIDTYVGGNQFAGEEALWVQGIPRWAMNYCGRVTGTPFSGDFLKQALLRVPESAPYRGPAVYREGDYVYCSQVNGSPEWFQGYEEIRYRGKQVYECYFHGGTVEA